MPTRALSKFQYGKESTRGTAVAATKILAGAQVKGVPKDRQFIHIEDALGVKMKATRSEAYEYLVQDTLTIPAAYFQVLPLIFSLGVKGNITATETTASQTDYAWDFTPSLTADNAPDTITLEMGDDVQAFEVEYVMFSRIKISGQMAQDGGESPVSIEAEYFGRQVTATSFTAALSLPTMTTMNAKLARLYKDATWANKGTTELTSLLRGFEIEIITGNHPKFLGSANRYFASHGEGFFEAMLTLTLEGASAADTLFDEYQAGTAKAYRLAINGPQIGSGVNHALQFDIWGIPEVEPLAEESNGNNLHQVLIQGKYDTTGGAGFDVNVITNTSAI